MTAIGTERRWSVVGFRRVAAVGRGAFSPISNRRPRRRRHSASSARPLDPPLILLGRGLFALAKEGGRAQLARCFAHRLVFSRDVADYETHHKRVRLFPGEGHEGYSGGAVRYLDEGGRRKRLPSAPIRGFPIAGNEAVDLVVEPLKQLTQFERRATAAILQNRNHEIPLTIDVPSERRQSSRL